MRRRDFERLVLQALEGLPLEYRRRLSNVDVIVRRRPTRAELERTGVSPGGTLFGLYQGVPLTARGSYYQLTLPDRIVIYQEPLERAFPDPKSLMRQIRRTVLHEVAHHMGIDDHRLWELGLG